MQIIKSRPIPLPVWKSGKWREDYAVTGGATPGCSLTAGSKTKTGFGIRLNATSGTTYTFALPAWYKYSNFEMESIMRHVAGDDVRIVFRWIDAQNNWYINLNGSDNKLRLLEVLANVYTIKGTYTIPDVSKFAPIGIEAKGPIIKVYHSYKEVLSVSDTDNINGGKFLLQGYNAVAGTASGEYQYLAINPK